jgi:hypothetical protein
VRRIGGGEGLRGKLVMMEGLEGLEVGVAFRLLQQPHWLLGAEVLI